MTHETVKPVRLQRSRCARLVSPNGLPIVCVTRGTRWGNPFRLSKGMSRWDAVFEFQRHVQRMSPEERRAYLEPLRGKNLACWCKPGEMCHADVLLWLANLVAEEVQP